MKHRSLKRLVKLLPVLSLVLVLLTTSALATDTAFDAESFVGLVLTAEDGVTVSLYSGFSSDSADKLTPVYTEGNTQYFEVTAGSRYRYVAKPTTGYGRYTIRQNIYISADEAAQKTVLDVTPAKRSTNGWDPPYVYRLADEVLEKVLPSAPELWPEDADVFTTPAFQEGRNAHMQTTQTELENFIAGLDGTDDDMYTYILGQSAGKTFNIPLVIFTKVDLSGVTTLEEAAALVKADSEKTGKLTVHYQAHIHGSEPAAGEGALAMIQRLDGQYGEGLRDTMNIYVIPRLNPYGAYKSQRNTKNPDPTAGSDNVDPNGDFLRLRMVEPQLRQKTVQLFDPDVALDGHEYQANLDWVTVQHKDIMLAAHFLPSHTEAFQEQAKNLAYAAFDELKEKGLSYGWYTDVVNNASAGVGSGNAAYRGILHVLMESQGIFYGRIGYERRVMGQVSVATGIFDYLDANAATVKAVVREQKQIYVDRGKTYEEDDVVVLEYKKTDHEELHIPGNRIDLATGELTAETFGAQVWDTVVRSRTAPTAYVIPAGESFTERVLDLMDMQGISYSFIPAGSGMVLQQYTQVTLNNSGQIIEAGLTDEQQFSFPKGAYVFSMAQVNANILSLTMEPDVTQTTTNTLVQSGVVPITDGLIPIYRYIHDLNADGSADYMAMPEAPAGLTAVGATVAGGTGSITGLDAGKLYEYRAEGTTEYTAAAAGATQISGLTVGKYYVRFAETGDTLASADAVVTVGYGVLAEYAVYLNSADGADTNNGYTEAAAVKSVAAAYSQLDAIMAYAPQDTAGKIVLLDTYTLSTGRNDLPAHDYPVEITGKTGTEGFLYTGGSTADANIVAFNGDTTLTNLTLTLKGSSTYNYLSAMGHRFVVGTGVTGVANSGGAYFNINGGDYRGTFASTDVTVLSGSWRQIYAGNYASGTITGDVNLKVNGATVTNYIQGTYNCTIGGDICMDLENVGGSSIIYCGGTSTGTVKGDMTVRLGKNVGQTELYAGGSKSTANGSLTVIADGVDLDGIGIYGRANSTTNLMKAILVLNEGKLSQVIDNFVCRDDATIVLGCDQTEEITLSKTFNLDLNGCDASGITVADGYTVTVSDSATDDFIVNDDQGYGILSAAGDVVAKEGYDVREETDGKSYHRWEFGLDGVTLRTSCAGIYYTGQFGLNELYQADVASYGVVLSVYEAPALGKENCEYSELTQWPVGGKGYGTVLTDIMKAGNPYSINAHNASTTVYGVAYIKYTDGTVAYSNEASFSLKYLVEYSDTVWEGLTQEQREGLLAMYETYETVMDLWEIPNIKAAGI